MLKEYFLLIIRNLENRKMRSFLTVLGVLIGVLLIILLFSLGTAMQNGVEYQFSKTGIKSIRVVSGGLFGPPSGSIGLSKDLKKNIETVRGVDYVQPVIMDTGGVEFNKQTKFVSTISYDASIGTRGFLDTDLKLASGRYFKDSDRESIIIGDNVAETLYKKKIGVKDSVTINGRTFKVIGVIEKTGTDADNRIYLPIDTARELFKKPDITNAFVVQVKPGYDIEQVAADIRVELMKKFKDKDAFQVFTPAQLLKQIKAILGSVEIVLVAIAAISLIVGSIGIMNSMFTSVLERTRDIGAMRAIGATKKDILLLFLLESGIIGIIGGVIGVILGVAIAYLSGAIINLLGFTLLKVNVSGGLILFSLGFSFLIGIISGTVPAIRAANLQPVEALRYE